MMECVPVRGILYPHLAPYAAAKEPVLSLCLWRQPPCSMQAAALMARARAFDKTLCRRLGVPIRSSDGDVICVQKALTAGLFMNAVQLSETAADLQNPSSSGINVYKMLRSSGPGKMGIAAPAAGTPQSPPDMAAAAMMLVTLKFICSKGRA